MRLLKEFDYSCRSFVLKEGREQLWGVVDSTLLCTGFFRPSNYLSQHNQYNGTRHDIKNLINKYISNFVTSNKNRKLLSLTPEYLVFSQILRNDLVTVDITEVYFSPRLKSHAKNTATEPFFIQTTF